MTKTLHRYLQLLFIALTITVISFITLPKVDPSFTYWELSLLSISIGLLSGVIGNVALSAIRKKNESLEREISELRYKSLRNQLDPHFVFNLMGSIKMMVVKQEVEKAEELFDAFIRLMRQVIVHSGEIESSLTQELLFAQEYLFLEQQRLGNKFDFTIENHLAEEVTIPRSLLQIHLENAVKHGVYHLVDRKGWIKVKVEQPDAFIVISITDNGKGRTYTKNLNATSTERGTQISKELCYLFEQLTDRKVYQDTEDLLEGTKVSVTVTA